MNLLARGEEFRRRHAAVVESTGRAVPGALVFVLLTVVAWLNGGYFPSTWGWVALGLLLVVVASLLAQESIVLGRLEQILLLALGAFVLWTALSMLWSESLPRTVLELQRDVVYLAAVAAFLLVSRRGLLPSILGGVFLSTVAVSVYALATELLPDRFGRDSVDAVRLAGPLGYWNALGLFAVIGVLLALGFAAGAQRRLIRCAAAASLPVLVSTVYFTFGRATWAALAVGVATAIAVDRRRLHMTLVALALVPASAVALLLASWARALAGDSAATQPAVLEGRRLAVELLVLAVASGVAPLLVDRVEDRIRPRRSRGGLSSEVVAVLVLLVVLIAQASVSGGLLGDFYDGFRGSESIQSGDLEGRLVRFSGSGRTDYWRIAWSDYTDHPRLGSGAGTYELSWIRERPNAFWARDAHSLYLEVLAELGPVGLALLLAALGTPLLALTTGRQAPLTSAAVAAYVAFLFHAGVDWDWEMPAVTLAGLFCGCAVVVAVPRRAAWPASSRSRAVAVATTVALGAFAFVGAVGNGAVASSTEALARRSYEQAEGGARRATTWSPWSSEAWRVLGKAQRARGNSADARTSFRAAVRRDPNDWLAWADLVSVTQGPERRDALAQVARLNPLLVTLASPP